MATDLPVPDPEKDPYGYYGLRLNPDGSITRLSEQPATPASADPTNPYHLSKDIPINQSKGTWARIFVPRKAFDSAPIEKLSLIVYFHGGGFLIGHADSSYFDNLYITLVAGAPAVVVSIEYRLAPEHRLPAAYDDCEESLHWLKSCEEEWLKKYADFSKCYLMGTSAGSTITYHVGLRAAAGGGGDLKPLQIKGLILHHAFFGGKQRTESELRLAHDKVVPLCVTDLAWELSLPVGADRDHEYSNPMVGIKPGCFDAVKTLGWKFLFVGYYGDPLVDRQIELAKTVEENGLTVVGKFYEGGCHGCDISDPSKALVLCTNLQEFIGSANNP